MQHQHSQPFFDYAHGAGGGSEGLPTSHHQHLYDQNQLGPHGGAAASYGGRLPAALQQQPSPPHQQAQQGYLSGGGGLLGGGGVHPHAALGGGGGFTHMHHAPGGGGDGNGNHSAAANGHTVGGSNPLHPLLAGLHSDGAADLAERHWGGGSSGGSGTVAAGGGGGGGSTAAALLSPSARRNSATARGSGGGRVTPPPNMSTLTTPVSFAGAPQSASTTATNATLAGTLGAAAQEGVDDADSPRSPRKDFKDFRTAFKQKIRETKEHWMKDKDQGDDDDDDRQAPTRGAAADGDGDDADAPGGGKAGSGGKAGEKEGDKQHLKHLEGLLKDIKDWQADHKKEEEFKAKIRAKQDKLSQRKEAEISVLAILGHLLHEVRHVMVYRSLPYYVLYVLCLVLIAAITTIESSDSKIFFHALGVRKVLSADREDITNNNNEFYYINDEAQYYTWLQKAATRLWGASDADMTLTRNDMLLGAVVLRQWRVREDLECTSDGFLFLTKSTQDALGACYPAYSDGGLSYEHYGSILEYVPNKDREFSVHGVTAHGQLRSYSYLEAAFTETLRFGDPHEAVQEQIEKLQTNKWIDTQTRAVSFGIVVYNQPTGSYAHEELTMEVTESGVWIPTVRSVGYSIQRIASALDYFVLIMDAVIVLWAFRDLAALFIAIKTDEDLNPQGYRTLGDILTYAFNIAFLTILGFYFYYKIDCWVDAFTMGQSRLTEIANERYGGDDNKAMYQVAVEYGEKNMEMVIFLAVAMVMTWLRFFLYLQYNQRIQPLTEALLLASDNLFSLFLIFAFVFGGFAVGGHMCYGRYFEKFRTLPMAGETLLHGMFRMDIEDYDALHEYAPRFTSGFFLAYAVIVWLLLLNMVTAVLTTSMLAFHEKSEERPGSWAPASLYRDCRHVFHKILNKHANMLEDNGLEAGERENYLESRKKAIEALKHWFYTDDSAPEYLTKEKLCEFLSGAGDDGNKILCKASAEYVFMRSSARSGAAGAHALRLGDRWASKLQAEMRSTEASVSRAQQESVNRFSTMATSISELATSLMQAQRALEKIESATKRTSEDMKVAVAANTEQLQQKVISEFNMIGANLKLIDSQQKKSMKQQKKAAASSGAPSAGAMLMGMGAPPQYDAYDPYDPTGMGGGDMYGGGMYPPSGGLDMVDDGSGQQPRAQAKKDKSHKSSRHRKNSGKHAHGSGAPVTAKAPPERPAQSPAMLLDASPLKNVLSVGGGWDEEGANGGGDGGGPLRAPPRPAGAAAAKTPLILDDGLWMDGGGGEATVLNAL